MKIWMYIVILCFPVHSYGRVMEGMAFIDSNSNGIKDSGEQPFSGLHVSNGRDIVTTDRTGYYSIEKIKGKFIFAIKPPGYKFPLDKDSQPRFYHAGGSNDFHIPLYPSLNEDAFSCVLMADPQVYAKDQINYLGQVATDELLLEEYDFMITLGDLVGNKLPLLPKVKETLGQTRKPCYFVIGNHDRDRGEFLNPSTEDNDSFEEFYGPDYYSFNRGDVHFLVLNNVLTIKPSEPGKSDYRPGIHRMQIQFIKNDLKHVSPDQLVVVCAHIPFFPELKKADMTAKMLALLKDFSNVFMASGHAHNQVQLFLGEKEGRDHEKPVHHLVAGTICGGWWRGEPDIFGIPGSMMRDGTPQGYWLMHVDGTDYKLEYKASGRSADWQMHIWVPQFNDQDTILDPEEGCRDIWVNVYAGDELTDVQLRIDNGGWQSMERREAYDPYILRLLRRQEIGRAPTPGSVPLKEGARICTHLWYAEIPEGLEKGTHVIEVSAKNRYGLNARAHRLFWQR